MHHSAAPKRAGAVRAFAGPTPPLRGGGGPDPCLFSRLPMWGPVGLSPAERLATSLLAQRSRDDRERPVPMSEPVPQTGRILIVDDESANVQLLERLLRQSG